MNFKVCMIGCGSFARQVHGPAQQRYADARPGVELAACCDVDVRRAEEFAEAFGYVRPYADVPGMLAAEKPDAVILAVPPVHTCHMAGLVLERGFPLLLEKPPGISSTELEQLIAAEKAGEARAQVAFNRHYMPVLRRALEILADVPSAEVRQIEYDMIRHHRWDEDFSTTAIHAVDGALVLARSPFRTAELRFLTRRQGDREATDVTIDAECVSGTRVRVNIQPVAGRNLDSARVHSPGRSLFIQLPVSPQSAAPDGLEAWQGDKLVATMTETDADLVARLGILGETEAFLDGVRSGAPFAPRLADCRQQVLLMEAIRLRRTGPIALQP